MFCLLCSREFNNYRGLSKHLFRSHSITFKCYIEKFNLGNRCIICNILLSKNNRRGYCVHHYNRKIVGLGAYGRKHPEIEKIKNSYNVKDKEFNEKLKSFKSLYKNEKIYIVVGNSKSIETWKVMSNQKDLVEIIVELQPLAVIKGE